MSMNNVGATVSQDAMQPVVGSSIKSPTFSEIHHRHVAIVQQTVEIAIEPAPDRDDHRLKPLPVQSPDDINRNPLCASWAEHGNDMRCFESVHDSGLVLFRREVFSKQWAQGLRRLLLTT